MFPTTVVNSSISLLQDACDRNVPLDLQYANPNRAQDQIESDTLYARARLLSINKDTIYLDSPQSIGKQTHLRPGCRVNAYFNLHGTIYSFRSTVTDSNCIVALNRKKTIVGMSMSAPNVVLEAQRREDHRVSLFALDQIEVNIHDAWKDQPGSCQVTAKRFRGYVINLSRGGMAARIEGQDRHLIKVGAWYYMSFTLPGNGSTLVFLAEARHIHEVHQGQTRRIGFQFLSWPNHKQMREKLAHLGRFLVTAERRTLRNKKAR